jgi:hypothetical protein
MVNTGHLRLDAAVSSAARTASIPCPGNGMAR